MTKRKTKNKFAFNKNKPEKQLTFTDEKAEKLLSKYINTYPQLNEFIQHKKRLDDLIDEFIKFSKTPEYKREKLFGYIQTRGSIWNYTFDNFLISFNITPYTTNKVVTLSTEKNNIIKVYNITSNSICILNLRDFKPVDTKPNVGVNNLEQINIYYYHAGVNRLIDSVEMLGYLTEEQVKIHEILYM